MREGKDIVIRTKSLTQSWLVVNTSGCDVVVENCKPGFDFFDLPHPESE